MWHVVLQIQTLLVANVSLFFFRSCKSTRALVVSFVFPSMFNKVPSKFSQMFFSMYITSNLCRNNNRDRYGSWKRTLCFVQFTLRFLFLSYFVGCLLSTGRFIVLNCSNISSAFIETGGGLCSTLPSCCLLLPTRIFRKITLMPHVRNFSSYSK